MVVKPTKHTDWASANSDPGTNIVEPSTAKKEEGWISGGEKPPYQTFNWIQKTQDEWNKYFEQETDFSLYGQFTIADNQAAAANVTNLIADKTKYQNWSLEAYIDRRSDDLAGVENSAFYTNLGSSFNSSVSRIVVDSNDNIFAIGGFSSFNSNGLDYIVKLDKDGNENASFTSNAGSGTDGIINDIDIDSDSNLYLVGSFSYWQGTTAPFIVQNFVKITNDGIKDESFMSQQGTWFNNSVVDVHVMPNGKIVFIGIFTGLNGNSRNRIVRINENGTEDTTFYTNLGSGFSSAPSSSYSQKDNKLVVVGGFVSLNGNTRNGIVRLDEFGNEDAAFAAETGTGFSGGSPSFVKVLRNGKIIITGNFTSYNSLGRTDIVVLNEDGTEDVAFYNNMPAAIKTDGVVNKISEQRNGKILVATSQNIYLLNPDGTEETSFATNRDTGSDGASVIATAIQSNNDIIAVGGFTTFDLAARNYMVKLAGDFFRREKKILTVERDDLDKLVLTELYSSGDDSGVDLFIDETTGQVSYTSSNVGGTLVTSELYYALRNDKLLVGKANSTQFGLVKSDVEYITDASATTKGLVNNAAQAFSGIKTFNSGFDVGQGTITVVEAGSDSNTPISVTGALDSLGACRYNYTRINNIVTMTGSFTADPTAIGQKIIDVPLHFASDFANTYDLSGTAGWERVSSNLMESAAIFAETTLNRIRIYIDASTTNSLTVRFSCTYEII